MKFIDEAKILVRGGNGGDGCISFRREKYVPRGGPDGGDGGNGGNVILEADLGRNTLLDLNGKRQFIAKPGVSGKGKGMNGRRGSSEIIRVPAGTLVKDIEHGEILADLVKAGQRYVAAKGGRGGKGNLHFASSTNRAPRKCQPGEEGETREIILELKLLADVGLVGRPNAGKSTFISKVSAARPKIADYPFTTLQPQLGVVSAGDHQSFTIADIPGLIEDAHKGAGMGIRFLRHIERTRVFLHLIDLSDPEHPDPWDSFQKIYQELISYSEEFSRRPMWVILTKMDIHQDPNLLEEIIGDFKSRGYPTYSISSVTGEGMKELIADLGHVVIETRETSQ